MDSDPASTILLEDSPIGGAGAGLATNITDKGAYIAMAGVDPK